MPIRFATDTFGSPVEFVEEPLDPTTSDPDEPDQPIATFTKQAFLVSKVPLDCSKKDAVDQFIITGAEPDGSSRRIIFKIDDSLHKFEGGRLVSYPLAGKFDDVIKWGNKVSTLAALSNISAFVGKKIYPIIALQAPADADDFPTIKLALATRSNTEQLADSKDTPVYVLADSPQSIVNVSAKTNLIGNADVQISIRLRSNGSWSAYMPLADAADKDADAVQFRIKYSVENIGSDSAQVESITVTHTSGQAVVTGDYCNLYSIIANYQVGLSFAYCLVHHAPLVDAKIDAFVNFMKPPKHKELVQVGIANGSRQELSLGDPNIVASSLRLYADGSPVFNFDFSTELATVILTAKKNSVITASYDYDFGQEEWLPMQAEDPQPYGDGSYASRFTYQLPNDVTDKSVANVRIRMIRQSGSASEVLGTATGKTQLFVLKHNPKPSTIEFDGNVTHSFDETTSILSCVASKGSGLNVSYSWRGLAPVVYSFAAGFAV